MDAGFIEGPRTRFLELDDTRREALRKVAPGCNRRAARGAGSLFTASCQTPSRRHAIFRDSSHQAQARERQIAHWKGILEARFD